MASASSSSLKPSADTGGSSSGGSSSSSSSSSSNSTHAPYHYFPTPALDHAFSGIVAGTVATICMNPLDLVKVQFQVDTSTRRAHQIASTSASTLPSSAAQQAGATRSFGPPPSQQSTRTRLRQIARKATGGDVLRDMSSALREIVRRDGYAGLYRGLSPNVVGNSASWGFYFLWYTMIKEYMATPSPDDPSGKAKKLSPSQHLLAASTSGAITALMTNPIWVVKTRMFTTTKTGASIIPSPSTLSDTGTASARPPSNLSNQQPNAKVSVTSSRSSSGTAMYNGLWQGLGHIWKHEGIRGLYKGAGLALVGVSNGAIQFVSYEELKRWRMNVARRNAEEDMDDRRRRARKARRTDEGEEDEVKLDNTEYIVMSGISKLAAITLTYPYQVVRSRIQNHSTAHIYPNIPTCIRLTWAKEGFRGFYKGMAANAIRILPGTCVTFVVYENCSWALRGLAERREMRQVDHREATSAH